MSSLLTFVVGIIVGLLIGWLIDLLYRRRAERTSGLEPIETQATSPAWASPLPEVAAEATTPPPAEIPVEDVSSQPENVEAAVLAEVSQEPERPVVAARVAEVAEETEAAPPAEISVADELPAEPEGGLPPGAVEVPAPEAVVAAEAAERAAAPAEAPDKLLLIEGIGPAYEARLRAAGINTFRQLVETSPERLREIIQPQSWQRVDFAEWIEQARLIVEGKDEELRALQARLFSRKKG